MLPPCGDVEMADELGEDEEQEEERGEAEVLEKHVSCSLLLLLLYTPLVKPDKPMLCKEDDSLLWLNWN